MTYWETHDVDLVLTLSREGRGGPVALWSLAAVFLIPGFMDGSVALIAIGCFVIADRDRCVDPSPQARAARGRNVSLDTTVAPSASDWSRTS